MIEIKGLKKAYKVKKEKKVEALRDINLVLPDRGMVFILGKSGSGKSTLLNVIGGVDGYDKGELILFGKSSKDFKEKDFDSYRNKYVGFIFQEYNVLPGLTAGQNVGLALELQGKESKQEVISQVLASVGLKDYIDRYPGQLSGGQRQRVAIARALVKDPKIILADEPTGALDTKSGTAIFRLLKKLSKDHLVVCVTHDAPSAEKYADRIIRIKEGKVDSDITNRGIKNVPLGDSGNAGLVTQGVISINNIGKLSNADLAQIAGKTKKSKGPAYVLYGGENRLPAALIESGEEETSIPGFDATKKADIDKNCDKDRVYKPQSSSVPLLFSLRMGASSLKHNPIRLIFTIVLSLIAFTFLGVSSILSTYDGANTFAIIASVYNSPYIAVKKTFVGPAGPTPSPVYYRSSLNDVALAQDKYGAEVIRVYKVGNLDASWPVPTNPPGVNNLYKKAVGYVAPLSASVDKTAFTLTEGRYPTEENEIAISSYQLGMFKEFGVELADGTTFDHLDSFAQIQDQEIDINGFKGLVTGLLDLNFDLEEGKAAAAQGGAGDQELDKNTLIRDYIENGPVKLLFMSEKALVSTAVQDALNIFPTDITKDNPLDRILIPANTKTARKSVYKFASELFPTDEIDKTLGTTLAHKSLGIESVVTRKFLSNDFKKNMATYSQIALYTAIATAAISVLLTMNYMFTSVAFKQQEIGILRGLGAKSVDVFAIFVWEALIIATINFAFAAIFTAVLSGYINTFLTASMAFAGMSIVYFGWVQVLILLAVSFGVSIISALIPSYSIASMKPVDAMKRRE